MKKIILIGRTNAGKSTLLKNLTNEQVAVSEKAHTTREIFSGSISSTDLILFDTPGINKQGSLLDKIMLANLKKAVAVSELVWWIVEAGEKIGNEIEIIKDLLEKTNKKIFLIINKIDLLDKNKLMDEVHKWDVYIKFDKLIPISAITSKNIQTLITETEEFFARPQPVATDDYMIESDFKNDEKKILKEIIREVVLKQTREELPHQMALMVDDVTEESDIYWINCVIIVSTKSQQKIILKKRNLAERSGEKITSYFNKKSIVSLKVKVEKNWFRNPKILKKLNYEWDH